MKKICAALLVLCMCMTLPGTAMAAEVPLQAPCAILMDGASGTVIYEKDADRKMPPASVTKIMTLLLVMEAIERGELAWEEIVVGSAHAASMGGSQIWLKEGEQFTVEEMVKCVAVASANDCSVALAEHLAGSEEAFVARMNERAQELGMIDTHFVNCCGLEAEGHLTTARDIAKMSAALLAHEKITEYTTVWTDTIRNGAFGLTNTNKMIRSYNGMIGLKTGYTSDAGYCLSGVAVRDGMTLIAVVLGGQTSQSRNADVAALLNHGFANYTSVILSPDVPLLPVPVVMGKKESVAVTLAAEEPVLLEKGRMAGLVKQVEMMEEVEAPVRMGEPVGSFTVQDADGKTVYSCDLVAAEAVERLGLWDLWSRLMVRVAFRTASAE